MEKVYRIPIRMERDIVFKRMHIYETQPNYEEFLSAYNELAEEIPKLVDARGIYILKKAGDREPMHKGLCEVSHFVYAMVSLGRGISDRCTAYFAEKDYLKGLMIDSIADQLLFNLSDDFYPVIREDVFENKGYALTVRYQPDDYIIPIQNQKLILDETDGGKLLGVSVTEGFMYNPLKTMGYVYGADKNIQIAEKDHDCSLCTNYGCEFRSA
ncbi:5-methyltetrahydrofolate--homocysteine methyltransferase [Eubacterium sp. 1001713B170207_170306_E7]|uniref:5-methyltetrahydrofolate--homocysteine methyltransferase n=1 Tax=Eubacterium sp. 1001713B170207_170306_E7 TaxID=2787097 RepID=UPI00189BA59D|nr:5-methyltetrahydrofolate--homocysteine methyltransferase [Eubacterium sp. 1001713B170207_170306_E7]